MLICTYLAVIAGYLFPVKMAQKLSQALPQRCPPNLLLLLGAPPGQLHREDCGQLPPGPGVQPQLPVGWRKPSGLARRRGLGGWPAPGGRRIKQKCKLPKPVINISSKSA